MNTSVRYLVRLRGWAAVSFRDLLSAFLSLHRNTAKRLCIVCMPSCNSLSSWQRIVIYIDLPVWMSGYLRFRAALCVFPYRLMNIHSFPCATVISSSAILINATAAVPVIACHCFSSSLRYSRQVPLHLCSSNIFCCSIMTSWFSCVCVRRLLRLQFFENLTLRPSCS